MGTISQQELLQRTVDAIRVKLLTTSPTVRSAIRELGSITGSDIDAVLRAFLSCTVGSALGRGGAQPSEAEIVEAADPTTKRGAVQLVIDQLWVLRDSQVETNEVSKLINRLQLMIG